MKKTALALALISIFSAVTPLEALADGLTPMAVALNRPVGDCATQNQAANLKAEIPEVEYGSSKGIDIVNDSLNYHSRLNAQSPQPNMNGSSMALQGNISQLNYANSNMNRQYSSQYGMNTQNQYGNMGQQRGPVSGMTNFPTQQNTYGMPGQMMPVNNFNNAEMMKKAVGVVGTAALIGVFVKSGGLTGMARSVGWDGRRHLRGSSIGGY